MAPWLIPLGVTALNWIGNMIGNRQQHKSNVKLMNMQNAYNRPSAQMARWQEAGMNPNLVYGQGTPGNMERPIPTDVQSVWADLGTKYQQSRLMAAQTDLTKVKTDESSQKKNLMQAQENLVKANPYMDKGYVEALVLQMQSLATLKAQEASFMTTPDVIKVGDREIAGESGFLKMRVQLDMMAKELEKAGTDQKIKAEIFKSKEFQNQLLKIQTDWMKDADITPQHIYLFVQMLMSKMF